MRSFAPLAPFDGPLGSARGFGKRGQAREGARPHTTFPFPHHLLREGFLIYHVRHLGDVAAVVPFQHVDQALHAASGHAFVGIG